MVMNDLIVGPEIHMDRADILCRDRTENKYSRVGMLDRTHGSKHNEVSHDYRYCMLV